MKTVGFLAGALLLASPLALSAQRVASLEFAESQYMLETGETFEVFVDASDSLGDFVDIASASWSSSDPAVVSVQMDAEVASIAILTGVGPGTARVSVVVQGVTAAITVSVTGPSRVEVTPDSVLTPAGTDRIAAATVRLEVSRFASEISCAAATVTDRAGLIVTSYSAIRGADRVIAISSTGTALGDVRVAAYDQVLDLAVLAAGTAPASEPISAFQEGFFWLAGFPNCGAVATEPVVVTAGEAGEIVLAGDVVAGFAGGAIANNRGQVFGVAQGGSSAVGAEVIAGQLELGSASVMANSLLSPRQVAAAEGHQYGAVRLQSSAAGATARITPIGATAWPDIATEQGLPFTFAGPVGSYNAALLVDGRIAATRVIRVQAGVTAQESLDIARPLAQQPQPTRQPPPGAEIPQASGGGGGFPMPLLIVGVIGGGVAALLASKKSTPPGNGNGNGNGTTTGTVTIIVPVP